MPSADFLQYGAMGVLCVVLYGVYRVGSVFVARTTAAFDRQAAALERVSETLAKVEAAAELRHGDLLREMRASLNGGSHHGHADRRDNDGH